MNDERREFIRDGLAFACFGFRRGHRSVSQVDDLGHRSWGDRGGNGIRGDVSCALVKRSFVCRS